MTGKVRGFLLALMLLVLAQPLFAQTDYRLWTPTDGVPIRQGYHIEWFRSMASDADGNVCAAWSDTRSGDRDLWAQMLDADGNELWGDEGINIVSAPSRQEDPNVMATSDSCWIVTWVDFRDDINIEDFGDIYMMKYDREGNPLWSPVTGVPVCVAANQQLWVQSFSDGDGGAVSIWVDARNGQSDIYGVHINSDGTRDTQWEENGTMIAGGTGDQSDINSGTYTADSDGNGGIIFGWIDNRNPSDLNLYCNRVDANGQLVWSDDVGGMPLAIVQNEQGSLKMAPDGNGGAFFIWTDRRIDFGGGDIYGQHISADGTVSWDENGVPICDAEGTQDKSRIINSAPGEAILVWEDSREDFLTTDLYTQRISDDNGNILLHWGTAGQETSGIPLCVEYLNQLKVRLTPDGNGGAFYSWVDERDGGSPADNLYAQHFDQDGQDLFGVENGIVVSDAPNSPDGNIVRALNDNTLSVLWFDYRNGSPGLYYQYFDFAGNELLQHNGDLIVYGIDNNTATPKVFPSDGNNNIVVWSDGRFGPLGNYIFAQKVDRTTGEAQWAPNGISLTPGYPYGESDTLAVPFTKTVYASDEQNGVVATWLDSHLNFTPYLFAQRIDADGNPMWGDRGVTVALNEAQDNLDQISPQIISSGDGGAIIVFTEYNSSYIPAVRAQRLGADGEGMWSENGNPGITIDEHPVDHEVLKLDKFDDGSILVIFRMFNDDETNEDLYAQRVMLDGSVAWDEPVRLTTDSETEVFPITAQVNGGVVVVWGDQRVGPPVIDIYGQLIQPDGTTTWTDGGKGLVIGTNQQDQTQIASLDNTAESFWLAWHDASDTSSTASTDIYAQRFGLNGNPRFDAVRLGDDDRRQEYPTIQLDSNNGAYIVWGQYGTVQPFPDLYYTHLNVFGEVVSTADYPQNGNLLCDAYHKQKNVSLITDGENGFVAAWVDDRSTGKDEISNIYMQRVNDYLASAEERSASIPATWALNPAYPNPFNPTTLISFDVATTSVVKVTVYDVLGRQVKQLVNEKLSAGHHAVMWNGRDAFNRQVASGAYFYRLESKNFVKTRKMVLLK